MKSKIDKLIDKTILIALIAQIIFIFCMNLFRSYTIIDFDSSSAYLHEIEMGTQGKIFPEEYSYQASMDLDSASILSAFLYHFTSNIFLARGIANNLVVLLYIYVIHCILSNLALSVRWKRFCILLFFIPYSMTMLGYCRMLFTGGGFYAFRALVPLLIISLILDIDKNKSLKKYLGRAILLLFIVFLTGLSSGAYVVLSAVFPLLLWEFVSAFLKGDYGQLKSKKTDLGIAAVFAALAGIIVQKAVGFSSTADTKYILASHKWYDAVLSSLAGLFELFGGLTIHEHVELFTIRAFGTAVDFVVTCIILLAIVYTFWTCIKKKELSNMHGYILSLMLVNAFVFSFLDLKYGGTAFESRYHLIPMLPSFFLLVMLLEKLPQKENIKQVQLNTIYLFITGLFITSMVFGDAQWVYAKIANECDKLEELNHIMEEQGIHTAVVAGEDNKALGRKLRVYSRDINYLVVNDGAESSFRTTFGGTTRYLDNAAQQGKTALLASPRAYETLPGYLIADMKYYMDYEGLKIYLAEESRFDYAIGPDAKKNMVIDFPYSPGYVYENAKLDEQGFLVMNEGGGSLSAEYNSVAGAWNYSVYYDTAEASGNAFMEIQIGENQFMYTKLDPSGGFVNADDVVMSTKAPVPFMINASEGVKIKRIEIRCKN